MIETLRIRNLAVVAQAEIELGPGLTALTGETGAGKSIVLGALALLAGSRASADVVREGADEAMVEAVLRCDAALDAALRERGIEAEEGSLVVARSVSREGRSRAWLAGRLVPVSVLAELIGERLEVASQHESQSLRRAERHGELLDAYGDLLALRGAVAGGHAALRALLAERAQLEAAREERERRRDFLAFQQAELDAADPQPGELAAIGAEHARLVHATALRGETAAAAALLAGDGLASDDGGAVERVDAAARRVEPLLAHDAALAPLAERLRAAAGELLDVARDLERYADGVDVDPARLAEVEARMALLEKLRRKYGRSDEDLLGARQRIAAELAAVAGGDARLEAIGAEIEQRRAALAADAAKLSAGRRKAAKRIAAEVAASLERLDLQGARLEVALEPVAGGDAELPCGASGAESVELRFSANPGEPPRALRKVASGGELSRVFLAIKNALRRAESGAVLVFDEADAGVGGRAAERVGALLAELGDAHQVLCITHWPQIAAMATTHLRVVKRTHAGRTNTAVEPLAEAARVEELARMAGGAQVGTATRAHARELLRGASRSRRPAAPPPR